MRQLETGATQLNLERAAVHVAAEIAAFEQGLSPRSRLVLILLIVASMVALEQGSTRLPVTGMESREAMRRILAPLCGDAFGPDGVEAMAAGIENLLISGAAGNVIAIEPNEYKPLVYIPPFIYHQRIRTAEVRLAEHIRPRLEGSPAAASERAISDALSDVLARPSLHDGSVIVLSEEQRAAIVSAARRPLAIISGGPGTGKTAIVLAVLRVLVRIGIKPADIAIAAPTGKAAFRMRDSIEHGLALVKTPAAADRVLADAQVEPATVHRLLGYSQNRATFAHHRNNPLPAAVVIVDESSMLDLVLMERLAGAMRPDAQLIMLGDADQLPSVAAGAVFRDLVAAAESGSHPQSTDICTRLTHSYRLNASGDPSRPILKLADRINQGSMEDGDGRPLYEERSRPEEIRFTGVEFIAAAEPGILPFLDRWFDARIRDPEIDGLRRAVYPEAENGFEASARGQLRRIFAHMTASRILCATRVLSTGTERINAMMHRRAIAEAEGSLGRFGFLPGEPVIVLRNDYERMLFNGDQGVIVNVQRSGTWPAPAAVFERGGAFVAFHLAALRESLKLSYATTIHKAQGSEFDAVAIVIAEKDLPILTRQLMYTAVTRAIKSVTLVGAREILQAAIARKESRYSGLCDLLHPRTS
jgi:exodeoxyribonuclease V alpha subunit